MVLLEFTVIDDVNDCTNLKSLGLVFYLSSTYDFSLLFSSTDAYNLCSISIKFFYYDLKIFNSSYNFDY